jgi:small subunit ribosomal protein S5
MTTETVTENSNSKKQEKASVITTNDVPARPKREFKKNKKTSLRTKPPRSEFDQRILNIRRVTRVSAGGRRFSFSVAVAIGNRKGKIGVGTGKAGDTSLAMEKAAKNAKKNLIEVKLTNTSSIPHEVSAKYSSAIVKIQPSQGRGVVAGSAIRDLIELGGIKDVVGKVISGSKNKLNIAQATVKAFDSLNSPKSHEAKKEISGTKSSRVSKKITKN